jgi:hypothetical protein
MSYTASGMKGRKQRSYRWIGGEVRFHVEMIQFLVYACKRFKMAQPGFLEAGTEGGFRVTQSYLWRKIHQIFMQISKSF